MKNWRIKTRRDWIIAFVFAALLVYGIAGRFSQRLDRGLMYLTDPRLSDLNQPSSYGNVALTVLVMGILAGIVLLAKKSLKKAVLSVAAGCVAAAVSIGAYFLHCSLLIHVPDQLDPVSVWVYKDWGKEGEVNAGYDPKDEVQGQFLRLCTSLEELPEDEQKQAKVLYEESEDTEGEIHIWIRYPEKYLHSYSLLLSIRDGQIFARRDGGRDLRFFADNGLTQAAEKLLEGTQDEKAQHERARQD